MSDNNDDIPEGAPLPPVIPLDPEVEVSAEEGVCQTCSDFN